ncbi:Hypothetical protein VV2_1696 [Vibrio vulnificus CMCP6]|uniref:Uncharacterized protein n=1 Tax=Vibrio vulnificus (strain CMCP6) TaxID=216895 RepID=A0A3Q0MFE7_VIBVU|nr:Hypothetical protein VV2_1696 [Vibrio vulnificus CMCP6]
MTKINPFTNHPGCEIKIRLIVENTKRQKARGFRIFISGSAFGFNKFANQEPAIYHRFVRIDRYRQARWKWLPPLLISTASNPAFGWDLSFLEEESSYLSPYRLYDNYNGIGFQGTVSR